jgi:hypothetical protein
VGENKMESLGLIPSATGEGRLGLRTVNSIYMPREGRLRKCLTTLSEDDLKRLTLYRLNREMAMYIERGR